jgi:hypothetical protein
VGPRSQWLVGVGEMRATGAKPTKPTSGLHARAIWSLARGPAQSAPMVSSWAARVWKKNKSGPRRGGFGPVRGLFPFYFFYFCFIFYFSYFFLNFKFEFKFFIQNNMHNIKLQHECKTIYFYIHIYLLSYFCKCL